MSEERSEMKNLFRLYVPFRYTGKKGKSLRITDLKTAFPAACEGSDDSSVSQEFFLEHVQLLIGQMKVIDLGCDVQIIILPTQIGYVRFTKIVNEEDDLITTGTQFVSEVMTQTETDTVMMQIIHKLKSIKGFVLEEQKCFWTFIFHEKCFKLTDTNSFKLFHLDGRGITVKGRFENSGNELEEKFEICKGNWCYISARCMGVVYNKELGVETLDNIDMAIQYMILLMQHERKLLIDFKRKIITKEELDRKDCNVLKEDILLCMSKYTLECVSNQTIYQNMYVKYKRVLGLERLEEAMQNLIFTLDAERAKKTEVKLTIFSVFISVLSVVSFALDLIEKFGGK